MAVGLSLLKYIVFFTTIFMAMTGLPVMALRDLPQDELMMKIKLLPLTDFITCDRNCVTSSDCSDGWICKSCKYVPVVIPPQIPYPYEWRCNA
ncbi:PREDICTED: fruit-specific protein-like [Nicotiana attenuata]|uniref:Uncharacterized protein n=1 Tax=Nicotiana attenuata TaxID=49451 RepID=A0A1J6KV54_NICAT|nr:PREDICTED: fruit-specific protein-like [Nicotiana attenuata]OIT26643.1 hypothetical protein A4A49_27776 [Nicotiana attenuata]